MKNTRDISDLKHKKPLRLGLLLLSTVFIISASALVYARIIYEKALDVSNTNGVTTGSGSTASAGVSFTPAAIVMLAASALVIGLSMFGFLRAAFKHISNVPGGIGSSPTGLVSTSETADSPVSVSPGAPGIVLSLDLPSMQREEWEESPTKERARNRR